MPDRTPLASPEVAVAAGFLLVAGWHHGALVGLWSPDVLVSNGALFLAAGALGALSLRRAVADGVGLGTVLVGALGALVLGLVVSSLHTLATAGGGVFVGGVLTAYAGSVLALAVVLRAAALSVGPKILDRLPGR